MTRSHRARARDVPLDERSFAGTFAAALVVAVLVLLWFGREQWFFGAEWQVLVDRDVQKLGDVLSPYEGHWISAAVVFYHLSFRLWGLMTYLPYQALVVGLHAGVVALVWLAMRRLGVRGWIATGSALALALFGAAAPNLVFGFRMTVTGAVLCGLGQLLLADHHGPLRDRDALGVVVGLVGLMSSAIALAFVVGVGVALVARRRWLAAGVHTVPLLAVYGLWYSAYGRDGETDAATGLDALRTVTDGAREALEGLGQNPVVSTAVAAVAALGMAVVVVRARRGDLAAVPLTAGLVATTVALAGVATRADVETFAPGFAPSPPYVYVIAVLVLPLVALAGEWLARRRTLLGLIPLVLLLAGVPGNLADLSSPTEGLLGDRDLVVAVAHSPLLPQAPADHRPTASPLAPEVGPTVAWLRAKAAGKVPGLAGVSRRVQLQADGLVALRQRRDPEGPVECERRETVVLAELARGDVIRFTGRLRIVVVGAGEQSRPVKFDSLLGSRLDVVAGPLRVAIGGGVGKTPQIC